jgi:putative transposon-encoded protein
MKKTSTTDPLFDKETLRKIRRERGLRMKKITEAEKKPKKFYKPTTTRALTKTVGRNSKNSGRIYLPGSWIGHKVIVTLVK